MYINYKQIFENGKLLLFYQNPSTNKVELFNKYSNEELLIEHAIVSLYPYNEYMTDNNVNLKMIDMNKYTPPETPLVPHHSVIDKFTKVIRI